MHLLVTGGAGYIGSHTCLELLEAGHDVTVVDNLSNAPKESLERVQRLTGRDVDFVEVDLLNLAGLREAIRGKAIDCVIHFAALKAVGESVAQPHRYYENNLVGSLNLAKVMAEQGIRRLVFSSSATVYSPLADIPVVESADLGPTNPYGQTKFMMEQVFKDIALAENWGLVLLRYFNPVGSHASGQIGEDPAYPNNLMPFIMQVAAGQREKVVIFGDDWPTVDGSGVRDYIHVVDLAQAHLKAVDRSMKEAAISIYNVGTGTGYSVKQMVEAARRITGQNIPAEIGPRRAGDVAEMVANPELAKTELHWTAKYGLDDMIASAWKWQGQNPQGYRS